MKKMKVFVQGEINPVENVSMIVVSPDSDVTLFDNNWSTLLLLPEGMHRSLMVTFYDQDEA